MYSSIISSISFVFIDPSRIFDAITELIRSFSGILNLSIISYVAAVIACNVCLDNPLESFLSGPCLSKVSLSSSPIATCSLFSGSNLIRLLASTLLSSVIRSTTRPTFSLPAFVF